MTRALDGLKGILIKGDTIGPVFKKEPGRPGGQQDRAGRTEVWQNGEEAVAVDQPTGDSSWSQVEG